MIGEEFRRQACQECRSQARRLEHSRPLDGQTEHVGLHLHEQIVAAGTSVDTQPLEAHTRILLHAVDDVGNRQSDRFERRAGDVAPARGPRDPDHEPPGKGIPVGRAQARQRRHDQHAAAVFHAPRKRLDLAGMPDHPQPVPEPTDKAPRHEHRSLEKIAGGRRGWRPAGRKCARRRGEQAVAAGHRLVAGGEHQKCAGPVGGFRVTRPHAALPKRRRLLVAGAACDRNRRSQPGRIGRAERTARWTHFGQERPRHAEQPAEFVAPLETVDVEEKRAAGVRDIGGMHATARESPDQEGVDRAEQDLPGLAPRP